MNRFEALLQATSLRPLWPVLYVAWADIQLQPDEVDAVHQAATGLPGLTDADAQVLAQWLDADVPPTAGELIALQSAVRGTRATGGDLAELGAALCEDASVADGVRQQIRHVAQVVGLDLQAAARALLAADGPPVAQHFDETTPSWPQQALTDWLDGDQKPLWDRIRTLLQDPLFAYNYDVTKEAQRARVLAQLHRLADEGLGCLAYPTSVGGANDPRAAIETFEALAMGDLSLVVKYGVQFGLFGGSILALGTERHHQALLPGIGTVEIPGGFAMTETGHGSNVRDLETRADYDPDTQTFVLHTPSPSARKEWIGNAAQHGRVMTVFAQLYTDAQHHGVHAFVVPVRDAQGAPLPGIFIEDNGHKMGLNGVDNGRLWFDNVRVPRTDLLDRYAQVSPEGRYDSPIASDNKRFFTMLGTLVGGRVSVAAGALSASKAALAIAVRYGALRRQFGPGDGHEVRILDYPAHQRRLMPALATAYALTAALRALKEEYVAHVTAHDADARQLEAHAAGLKALCTWHAIDTAQAARECCGGAGFLSNNRLPSIRTDVDVFATFEGDNVVLLQLVARGLLGAYADAFRQDAIGATLRQLRRAAATALLEKNPHLVRRTDEAHLRDASFHLEAFRYHEHTLLVSAARRIRKRIDGGMDPFAAFTDVQSHLIALANAHVTHRVARAFAEAVASAPQPLQPVLEQLRTLHAVWNLHQNAAWFLEDGYFENPKGRAIRKLVDRLCAEVRPDAVALVDALGIPDAILHAPIAMEQYIDRAGPPRA